MTASAIIYTAHALGSLAEREIERAWVEAVLGAPEAVEADAKHPERRRAYGSVPQRGGRILRVVFVLEGDVCRIVTAFFDRGRRRIRREDTLRPRG
ncbi:DUF4258 domain-containing protein [Methylobacterium sp. BE186]|uniref:DUF4258 domain-containing protein n=1 Tax=Methylobacterium sp. BE186 TaxID=2817715 RepID=UPI00286D19D6|nr:DUF4258 domain-containing protein [Methylobacterium sp. BE186]